jgi:uncharacterized protein (DUF1697 family)
MPIYVSILRGINVTGRRVKMELLRQLYVDLNFKKVSTYIQSGNVLFDYKKANCRTLGETIGEAIKSKFSFYSPVMVKDIEELNTIINDNPFLIEKSKDPAFLHITFLSDTPELGLFDKILLVKSNEDEIKMVGKNVYLYCPNGYSNSKFTNSFLENKLKVTATTRNWKTTVELLKLANEYN